MVGSSLALTGAAALVTASPAGAIVSNAGAIHVAFAGSLSINGALPIVISGIAGTADGTVDSAGNVALPQGSISFPPFVITLAGLIPTTVTIVPTADWTGTIGPNSGVLDLSAPQTAHLDLSAGLPGDSDCPVGPLALNLTTGASGAVNGTAYNNSTGVAEIVDGLFAIPAIPASPAPANCPDAGLIDFLAPLPLSGGLSVADLTATITPVLVDNDLGVNVPANFSVNATSPSGATVTYTATPKDEDSPVTATVSCLPTSGSTFAIGSTPVTCTATDSEDSPTTASSTFTVTVRGPGAQLQHLLTFVQHVAPGTILVDPVSDALAFDKAENKGPTCTELAGFIQDARALAGKRISKADAAFMIEAATRIRNVIAC